VPELAAHLGSTLDLESAIHQGAAATRRYAKRQTTWFRNRFSEDWHRNSSPTLSNVDL
jgi:tRNA dimethylallyltransferase